MAIEATSHFTLFSPQFLHNKQTIMIDSIDNGNFHTAFDSLVPMYGSGFTGLIHPDPFKFESPVSRKRSRVSDFSGDLNVTRNLTDFTFLGEDVSNQIQQQQFEIDQFVALYNKKVRAEIEYRRKRNSTSLIAALEEAITNRLKAKEDEIMKLSKLNYALEEKVKSLCVESEIWRELALTNEATANALRDNLKKVLERENDAPDAQSCCGSNYEKERTLAEQDSVNRMCKSCWKAESCVLLLPCRHLCLCRVCASSVNICPICKSIKNISVNVQM